MTASPVRTYAYKYLLLLLHFRVSLFVASVSCSEWKYQWVLGENLKCFLRQKEDRPPLCMMGGWVLLTPITFSPPSVRLTGPNIACDPKCDLHVGEFVVFRLSHFLSSIGRLALIL